MTPETKIDGFIEANESLKQIELITHVSFFAPTWVGYQRDLTLSTGRSSIIGKTGSEYYFPWPSSSAGTHRIWKNSRAKSLLWTCTCNTKSKMRVTHFKLYEEAMRNRGANNHQVHYNARAVIAR